MLIESKGITDISPRYVYEFSEENEKGIETSVGRKLEYTLNFLSDVFNEKTIELREHVWIVTIYLVISNLIENYTIPKTKKLKKFFLDFYKFYKSEKGEDRDIDDL